MPMVPLRGAVIFPDTVNHFDVGRKKSIAAVEQAQKGSALVFLVTQRDMQVEEPQLQDLYTIGVVAEVKQTLRFSENLVKVLVECKYRARIKNVYDSGECYYADVVKAPLKVIKDEEENQKADAVVRSLREQLDKYYSLNPKFTKDVVISSFTLEDYRKLSELIAFNLPFDFQDKQAVLEESNVVKRLELLLDFVSRENSVMQLEQEISEKVQDQMDKNQREYYLREQIRVISDELGTGEDTAGEAEEYRRKIALLPLADEHKKKLLKEADRLAMMQGFSQEASVIRTYLDTVLELPWGIYTADNYDIIEARKILDRDHYGLDKVKDRIIEFLAVHTLTNNFGAQIICLVGPPGVGKTSIASCMAEAMGRKFVRMSLGGVSSEAEIRGHRRTYIGSMPGRIIDAIQQAGTNNPLILLDEIDKLANDHRGDPASALLEVLDPAQNGSFRDHFLDIPYDLSKVLFITTANNPGSIPGPLYDRMDIIELSSYTREEKFKIAKQHLVKRQVEKGGLSKSSFSITDRAIYSIIDDYTREAGVRTLERTIAKLVRKAAVKVVMGETQSVKVNNANLEALLGPPISRGSIASSKTQIGVVNGLAWTSVGGELLPIEVVVMPGTGKIEITGSLGDVMKESAKIALTIARTLPKSYNIPDGFESKFDIHIHAPEGAVPKDGPSAGVTLTTAIVSALSGVPVSKNVAMTGEVTLMGDVLPIGGLKEKLIAAYKEKIKIVAIPKQNMSDLVEIPAEIRDELSIIPVEKVRDVLRIALVHSASESVSLAPAKASPVPKSKKHKAEGVKI